MQNERSNKIGQDKHSDRCEDSRGMQYSNQFPQKSNASHENFHQTNTFEDLEPLPLQQEERFIPRRHVLSEDALGEDDEDDELNQDDGRLEETPIEDDSEERDTHDVVDFDKEEKNMKTHGHLLTPNNADLNNSKQSNDRENPGFVKTMIDKDNNLQTSDSYNRNSSNSKTIYSGGVFMN